MDAMRNEYTERLGMLQKYVALDDLQGAQSVLAAIDEQLAAVPDTMHDLPRNEQLEFLVARYSAIGRKIGLYPDAAPQGHAPYRDTGARNVMRNSDKERMATVFGYVPRGI